MANNDKPVPKNIEELLRMLSAGQELSETQQKQMKDYKFWKTQPVPALDEPIAAEGPIEVKAVDKVPAEPLPMLDAFEWSTIDVENSAELEEVYQLLYENYVEDQDATFRFKYSHEFFRWGLKPPGWKKEWHVGVRVKDTKKLVAFIAAIPVTLHANQAEVKSVEINFLCIHKKLRAKRLAPVLIREITRRVNRHDIWQALYTAGVVLPSPVATSRYTHRPINWGKLHDVGFSHLPSNQTRSGITAFYALPSQPKTKGLRPMTDADLDEVHALLHTFQQKFALTQVFAKDELRHWLLGADVVKSYVVEKEGRITDFFSYYLLPFTVLENADHSELGVAYLFYYASESSGQPGYKQRLTALMNDALITSKQFGVDVFNALAVQDNSYFIKDCKFGSGDGFLNYYLFNYKMQPVHGGIDPTTKEVAEDTTSGVGVVLL
ncbi:glycylpeptide N-tetradecanoyltransferase [Diutina catenulata]